jgi:hypothetical protein
MTICDRDEGELNNIVYYKYRLKDYEGNLYENGKWVPEMELESADGG